MPKSISRESGLVRPENATEIADMAKYNWDLDHALYARKAACENPISTCKSNGQR